MVEYYESHSEKPTTTFTSAEPAIDKIWHKMNAEHPTAASIEVHVPENDSASIEAVANPNAGTYWKADYRYFDQYSLKELDVKHMYGRYANTSVADKIIRMNYDVHTGAIWGIAGKILAFLGSLIAASLPVTGFLIWRGRHKKRMALASGVAENEVIPSSMQQA